MNPSPAIQDNVESGLVPGNATRQEAFHPGLTLLLPLALIAIYIIQCVWFIRTQSFTFDEPVHIVTGWDMWRHGRFQYWNDHPPLGRLLCVLPILGKQWRMDIAGHFPEFRALAFYPGPEAMAHRGRAVNVILGAILATLLWLTARRLFSAGAGNLALALFVFSPSLITHFSLITTDAVGVLCIFATAIQLVRWRHNPSRGQTILLGIVMGLLLLAKFYTPPMFLIALGWMLILQPNKLVANPTKWNWQAAAAVCGIAFLVLWAGYFFHISHLSIRDGRLIATFPHREPIIKNVRSNLNFNIPIPAGEYLEGLRSLAFHNHRGHQAFFLGKASQRGGWKTYYPVVILLKWPTVVVVLFLTSLLLIIRGRLSVPRDLLIMASFPVVFFLFAVFSKIDIGDRHVLPIYPFALLFVSASWQLARRSRPILIMVLLALGFHVADALRYAPDYLSYMSPFVSQPSYMLLSDSNLDWGQGLLALRHYEAQHPSETIYLAYFGSVESTAYGLRAQYLPEGKHVAGATVVVSATTLTGQMLENATRYRWVLRHPEKTVLNHSLHVFQIPPQ